MVKGTNHVFFNVNKANISVTAGSIDTTAPTAPTLVASGTTLSSTNLSWSGAADNVGVTGYDVYKDSTLLGSTSSTSYSVTGLSASTTYTFTVKAKDAAGNFSVESNTVSVTTLSASTVTYCTSQGNSTTDEKIAKVVFGTINNSSTGTSGYEDFTSLSTDVTSGNSYTITITPSWTSTIYNEGYSVWIDYNKDGDFLDSGEQVFTKAASKTTPVSGTFTIPATATLGTTRMRVQMKYNAIPKSCESFTYGQVEDYTVNIQNSATFAKLDIKQSIRIFPNPAKDFITITGTSKSPSYKIFDMSGKIIKTGMLTDKKVNVTSLPNGLYLIQVEGTTHRFIKE